MVNVDECTGRVMLSELRKECRISHQCHSNGVGKYLKVLGGQYC